MVGWECVLRVVLQQAFIMVVDNLSSIAHAAVADLNGVVVEYFPQFVACWELSKHIWNLRDNDIEHSLSWRIITKAQPYSSTNKRCNLCLKEKLLIIRHPHLSSLNKRNELVSSCRHRNKALLRNN